MSMYFHEYDYSALITIIISAIITAMDRIIIIDLVIDFNSVCNTTTNLFR